MVSFVRCLSSLAWHTVLDSNAEGKPLTCLGLSQVVLLGVMSHPVGHMSLGEQVLQVDICLEGGLSKGLAHSRSLLESTVGFASVETDLNRAAGRLQFIFLHF
jgi:hypothetical protein